MAHLAADDDVVDGGDDGEENEEPMFNEDVGDDMDLLEEEGGTEDTDNY